MIFEVKSGPFAGKRVAVMGGQTVSVGRTTRANFVVPHDTFMSGLHFSVEFGPRGCLLTDQKSANGTFVNGTRVTQTMLNNGDEVRSGQTIFAVRIVADEPALPMTKESSRPTKTPQPSPLPSGPTGRTSQLGANEMNATPSPIIQTRPLDQPEQKPRPALAPSPSPLAPSKRALKVGSWSFSVIPDQWVSQGEFGFQREAPGAFPTSVVVSEEPLGSGFSLQRYVEAQLAMLRQYLREPEIEPALPPKIGGAEETIAIDVRYKTKEAESIYYRRIYSRVGQTACVLTFTTLEKELVQLRPVLDAILAGASLEPGQGLQN